MNKALEKLQPAIEFAKRYIVLIVIVGVGAVYGYFIFTSGKLASSQPSNEEVSKGYKKTNSPKMDEAVERKLTELQESNIQYKALIDSSRTNPFQE